MEKQGWKPVYWSVVPSFETQVKQQYPDVICHNHYDAMRGIRPSHYKDKAIKPVCPTFFQRLVHQEKIAMRMLERNDSNTDSFSYRERQDLYRDLVAYWKMVLEDLKPDYVVFEETPHIICDYVLYIVCRLMGVETIMFITTKFNEQIYPINDFKLGSPVIAKAYRERLSEQDVEPLKLSESMQSYFDNLQGSYDKAVALHLYDQVGEVEDILANKNSLVYKLKSKFDYLKGKLNFDDMKHRWRLFTDTSGKVFMSDQKLRNKSFKDSRMTYVQFLYYKYKALARKAKLKKYYHSLVEDNIDFDVPFVFAALHYQPERTTCPLGDEFDDQLYMIQLLSEAMPKGWFLYVKDHASQFVTSFTRYGERFRSEEFYQKIVQLENVKLLPLSSDTFELVDCSRAIATVTGTTGWEAVVRGKPAIMFGHSWFKSCEGVFHTPTKDKLKEVLDLIQDGYQIDFERVKIFADVVDKHSFPGLIGGPGVRDFFDLTDEDNAKAHARAINSLLQWHVTNDKTPSNVG